MTWVVIAMVLVVVVALVVISVFAGEERDDDWSARRPGSADPGESGIDDLLEE